MAYDADFGEWVREHFEGLGPLEIKRMFGGAGVYASGVMFALLDDGVVWLKADQALAPRIRRRLLGRRRSGVLRAGTRTLGSI